MIKKNVCMRLSPERIQRGFNVQVGYGIHTWFSFGVLLIDGKDGEWLSKEES